MKKGTFILCLLSFWVINVFGSSYYVAPGGNDSNSGTLSSPFKTLEKAVSLVSAGDYIYLRGGTYSMTVSSLVIDRSKSGSAGNLVHVFAYGSETPVLSFDDVENSSSRGIVQDAAYWHWKGIAIEKAGDNGMLLSGNNNTIENCVFRSNHDTGLQLSRYNTSYTSISDWPSNNLIVGCEAFNNKDSDNEDADGFAAKLTCGNGNVFRNCVSHHNIDDGWDLYTKSDIGPIGVVFMENCIAHDNGILTDGVTSGGGDKNGFKLGSSSNTVNHILRRCVAFNNGKHGFTDNGNIGSIEFTNLTSYNNGDYNFHTRDNASHVFKNCVSFNGSHTDRIVGDASAPNAFTDTDTDWSFSASSADFETVSPGDNSAPLSNGFLNLKSSSPLVDAGVSSSGITYSGASPDLGAVEYGGSSTVTTYSLSTSVVGSGTVSPSSGSYSEGSNVTLTATPASGWSFSNWTGDASGSSNPLSVTMSSDRSITAVFVNDDGDDDDTGGVVDGSTVRIEDTDAGTISYDGSLKSYSDADNGTAINLGNSVGQQIVWNYSATASGTYSITLRYIRKASMVSTVNIIVNGGSAQILSLSETTSSVFATASLNVSLNSGVNEIILETNADGESADIDWIEITGGSETTDPSITYSLTTSVTGEGTISPSQGTYEAGTSVVLVATPASGWLFDSWSGGYTGTTATVVMDDNKSVTATFVQVTGQNSIVIQENTIGFCGVDGTVDSDNDGYSGSGFANTTNATSSGIDYKVSSTGGSATLTVQYANGSSDRPAKVIVNGSTVVASFSMPSTGSWTTWTSVSTSITLNSGVNTIRLEAATSEGLANIDYVEFLGSGLAAVDCEAASSDSYSLTVSVSGSGSVSPASASYDAGTTVLLTASPASGWAFDSWSGSVSGTSNPLTVVVNSNMNVTANFTQSSSGEANFDMVGYATVNADGYATTTGGAGGSVTTVSSLSALQAWASDRENNTSPAILYIDGKISASSTEVVTIKHGANVSVYGIGNSGELENIGLNIWDYENVIVRNLKIHEVLYPNDALTIDACNHVWIDHCELYSKVGDGVGYDTYDGLLDIKRGSKYVTVSWCYLHDHMKCSLIGHTDNTSSQDVDSQMRITYHHNYFYNTDGRNPSIRYGAIHMFNNYFDVIGDYGLAARDGAHALVENCHYNDVLLSMSTDKFPVDGLPNGYICQSGNLFTGSTGSPVISQTGCDWWNIPYNYSLDPVSSVASSVPSNVGVGIIDGLKSTALTSEMEPQSKTETYLSQYYPNPFTDAITVSFTLANASVVELAVYDIQGRKVAVLASGSYDAGQHSVNSGELAGLPDGVYVCRLKSENNMDSIRIIKE